MPKISRCVQRTAQHLLALWVAVESARIIAFCPAKAIMNAIGKIAKIVASWADNSAPNWLLGAQKLNFERVRPFVLGGLVPSLFIDLRESIGVWKLLDIIALTPD